MSLIEKAEWKKLQGHYEGTAKDLHMRKLFDDDANRFSKFR